MTVLLYNLALLGVDLVAVRLLRRRPGALGLVAAALVVGTAAAGLAYVALVLSPSTRYYGALFVALGLLGWAVFAHGLPLAAVATTLLWRAGSRGLAAAVAAAGLALALAGAYGYRIEPTRLEVTRHRIESAKLARPLRLVVLSDLQTDVVGPYERRAVRTAMAQEPDLLLLPGDYLHVTEQERDARVAELNALLREEGLGAPLGAVAVEGNVDRPGWPKIFDGLDVRTFEETGTVELGGLAVTGLSLRDSFDAGLTVPGRKGFHVVVGHAPDFALGEVRADLLVAGHTHGGQVRLPWLGPVLTLSRVPRSWAAGRTELPGGRTLVVSRGVGLERGPAPRVRFLCRPEIVVLDLVPRPEPGAE